MLHMQGQDVRTCDWLCAAEQTHFAKGARNKSAVCEDGAGILSYPSLKIHQIDCQVGVEKVGFSPKKHPT